MQWPRKPKKWDGGRSSRVTIVWGRRLTPAQFWASGVVSLAGADQKIVLGGARWTWVAEDNELKRDAEGVEGKMSGALGTGTGVYQLPNRLGSLGERRN